MIKAPLASRELPSYERPPVVETVLGVQFDPLPSFRNVHLGAFWKRLGKEWPNVIDAAPLAMQYEQFGPGMIWRPSGLHLELSPVPLPRIQAKNASGDRMIQFQNGRIHYNWIGEGGQPYPRYHAVRPEFDFVLESLGAFLESEALGAWAPNQWEITYINHVPRGTLWSDPEDLQKLLRLPASVPPAVQVVKLQSVEAEWHYEIKPERGRLHLNLRSGRLGSPDGIEVLAMTLTARGPVAQRGIDGLSWGEGLDLGHETIVRLFDEITSEIAQKYWGRIDEHA